MVKIIADVTNPELDALEDVITVYLLCKKHSKRITSDWRELDRYQYNCKNCLKELNKARKKALGLWSNLVHAYTISRYGKCEH